MKLSRYQLIEELRVLSKHYKRNNHKKRNKRYRNLNYFGDMYNYAKGLSTESLDSYVEKIRNEVFLEEL